MMMMLPGRRRLVARRFRDVGRTYGKLIDMHMAQCLPCQFGDEYGPVLCERGLWLAASYYKVLADARNVEAGHR